MNSAYSCDDQTKFKNDTLSRDRKIRFRPCISVLLIYFVSYLLSVSAQTTTPFKLQAQSGPYAVGLRVVEQYDYSRIFQPSINELGTPFRGERARPLQTLVWYPAQKTTSIHVAVGDYASLQATQTSFGHPKQLTGFDERLHDRIKSSLPVQTLAVRDAPPTSGHFPVIVYAPSFSSVSWENADLCEFLASYGYVVIATPEIGATSESHGHDLAVVNAQAQDISFLIGYASRLSNTNTSQVAVVGFSWGGISNLFAAARDDRIKALVALDGSMRYWPGLIKQALDVHPEQMTIPLLFFKSDYSLEDEARLSSISQGAEGPNVLNEWTHGDLISVQMFGFLHPEFTSLIYRYEGFWVDEFPRLQVGDYGRDEAMVGYSWVARYSLKFLDAYLKNDVEALAFLKSRLSENRVPQHLMAVSFRGASATTVSFASFRAEVGRQGFDHLTDIYESTRKNAPDFRLDADTVSSWGYDLIAIGHPVQAIEVMKLAIQIDPNVGSLIGLAEAYRKAGQTKSAVETYQKVLEKDPQNIAATQRLSELKKQQP